jgi:hypothetical protein
MCTTRTGQQRYQTKSFLGMVSTRPGRDQLTMHLDPNFHESHYVRPIEIAQPGSQPWVDKFNYTAWLDIGVL